MQRIRWPSRYHRMMRLALVIAACAACGTSSERPARSWSDDPAARVAADERRTCPRPVLRGTATPGAATVELAALLAVGASSTSGELIAVIVQRAAAYETACTPFGPRTSADDGGATLAALRTADLAGSRAAVLADAGRLDDALALALDSVRVFQDLGRGPVTLLGAMVADAGEKKLIARIGEIVASHRVPADLLARTAREIDALLATEPPFADVVAGELDWLDLNAPADMLPTSRRIAREVAAACPPDASLASCHDALVARARERSRDRDESWRAAVRELAVPPLPPSDDATAAGAAAYLAVFPPYVERRARTAENLASVRRRLTPP